MKIRDIIVMRHKSILQCLTFIFFIAFAPYALAEGEVRPSLTPVAGAPSEENAPLPARTTKSPSYEAKRAEYEDLDEDPLEPLNRQIFAFNEYINALLLDPVANMYRMGVPEDVQILVANLLHNASEPVIFLNDCLQKRRGKALESFSRFFINTVFGVFGIFDVAKKLGLDPHKETFNTTLKYYGVPQGPYLVLPVFGSANPRFIVGTVVDFLVDPVSYYAIKHDKESWTYWRTGMHYVTVRANLTEDVRNFRENSIDFYAALRSFYKQYMDANRMDGKVQYESPSLDEFMFDDDEEDDDTDE